MPNKIAAGLCSLKRALKEVSPRAAMIREPIPLSRSELVPVDNSLLESMHRFSQANPIYEKSYERIICGVRCVVYEGDGTDYWLQSKKHDSSYQPFYTTWLLSALTLVMEAKLRGYLRIIDVGAGDGRIAYCGSVLGLESHGIELDAELVRLQEKIRSLTRVNFEVIQADATNFDYQKLNLNKAILFVSALPELGEMIANTVIDRALATKARDSIAFCLMGSFAARPMVSELTNQGWGNLIKQNNLSIQSVIGLPTQWTMDSRGETPYLYATPVNSSSIWRDL